MLRAVQVEGVGLGAIAAAAKMGNVDPLSMATWKAGEPVPFSFLVDTFDVRTRPAPASPFPTLTLTLTLAIYSICHAPHTLTLSYPVPQAKLTVRVPFQAV